MRTGEVGSSALQRIVELAHEVRVVLASEPWETFGIIAFRAAAVAGRAALGIQTDAMVQRAGISRCAGSCTLKCGYITGHVGNVLGKDQVWKVCEVLHAHVPAFVVTVVDQLPGDDVEVLTGNGRHAAVDLAGAVRPVTASTGLEQDFAVGSVDGGVQHRLVFILAFGGCCYWRAKLERQQRAE